MATSERVPMAAPNLQYLALQDEIDRAVKAVLAGGQYYLGRVCQAL
jgi:hypothetical protein